MLFNFRCFKLTCEAKSKKGMQVFKFGGASIKDIERIQNTVKIIKDNAAEPLLVVISAMGKTTNALEAVVDAFYAGRKDDALQLFEQIKQNHIDVIKYTLPLKWKEAEEHIKEFFTEVEWLLHDKPVREYDYYYDQIVCVGELLSTCIVHHILLQEKAVSTWIDVRDIFRTDNNFRAANVDFAFTEKAIEENVKPRFNDGNIVLTQGFIGSTDENESVTLGREGSDYSAAIFANILNAKNLTIWKDVPSVMNADPNKFSDAVKIPKLTFNEVIEMAYYGAQVIHPKTIKPLQNKGIPLFVKSFLDTSSPGTIINSDKAEALPPIIVLKTQQALLHFKTNDFSFIEGNNIAQLLQIFTDVKWQPNLTQNTAISLVCCFDDREEKINAIAAKAAEHFEVEVEKNLTLLTIRHYNNEVVNRFLENKRTILQQKTVETLQTIYKD
jgi:aspartate kinase